MKHGHNSDSCREGDICTIPLSEYCERCDTRFEEMIMRWGYIKLNVPNIQQLPNDNGETKNDYKEISKDRWYSDTTCLD